MREEPIYAEGQSIVGWIPGSTGPDVRRELPQSPMSWAGLLALSLLVAPGCEKSPSPDQKERKPSAESQESSAQTSDTTGEKAAEKEQAKAEESTEQDDLEPSDLRGEVQPGKVTEVSDRWRKRLESVDIDAKTAEKLGGVEPGATVHVYFGIWCGDSLREVPRFWKSLEVVESDIPFDVEHVALDRELDAGEATIDHDDITLVPTFVVERDGREVGRIVESAPNTLEEDLLALLSGETEGVVSGREDM